MYDDDMEEEIDVFDLQVRALIIRRFIFKLMICCVGRLARCL